jgi:MoaA/NifB/PqqE/SkfB family radical SAM enzyme
MKQTSPASNHNNRHAKERTRIGDDGRVGIDRGILDPLGMQPGASFLVERGINEVRLLRPVEHLAHIYIEATNTCNLNCRTCIRNAWGAPSGVMTPDTFERILSGIRELPTPPTLSFGGFGEPLMHPDILEMIRQCKEAGARVELITNGILLEQAVSEELLRTGLDQLWVSIDGARPESYLDVRLGNALPKVIKNLYDLNVLQYRLFKRLTLEVGIAFVAMRRNISDLPEVIELGNSLGIHHFSISNLLPYTSEMNRETLFKNTLHNLGYQRVNDAPNIELARMDMDPDSREPLAAVLSKRFNSIKQAGTDSFRFMDSCPFIRKGSFSIRWDGAASPCLPLLYDHHHYLDDRRRKSTAYTVGNVADQPLDELWQAPEHLAFRERVQAFDFSPCTTCNSCELADDNLEDCYGNPHPTCGGCLWAQGFIRCP